VASEFISYRIIGISTNMSQSIRNTTMAGMTTAAKSIGTEIMAEMAIARGIIDNS